MAGYGIQLPQFQQIISGGENDLFSNGIVQIHIPSKIEISVFISNTCTHFYSPVSAKNGAAYEILLSHRTAPSLISYMLLFPGSLLLFWVLYDSGQSLIFPRHSFI